MQTTASSFGQCELRGGDLKIGGAIGSGGTIIWGGGALHAQTVNRSLNVTNGTFSPIGYAANVFTNTGIAAISGSYTQAVSGDLLIQIGGTDDVGGEFDQLAVTGAVALGGTLSVELVGGFVPSMSDTFVILTCSALSGTFDNTPGNMLEGIIPTGSAQITYDTVNHQVILSHISTAAKGTLLMIR